MRPQILALALLASSPAVAADFDIAIDNLTASHGIAAVVFKVTNNTGQAAEMVFIDCVFMDKDMRAIDIGKALVSNIPAGGVAYDKAAIPRTAGVENVSCRVTRAR